MDFKTAAQFTMPFGQFKGQTLDDIAATDHGLGYLDWLRGGIEADKRRDVAVAICTYLDDPTVAADVDKLARESR